MFGYVTVNQPELKFREFDRYHSFYCGLCRCLKEKGGIPCQLTLSYDMTFLILLLTALYEPETGQTFERCLAHPLQRHEARQNEFTDYAADMNILLGYYHCLDDWEDDRKVSGKLMSLSLNGGVKRVREKYPEKAELIRRQLEAIHVCEKEKDPDPDRAAGLFGRITEELFLYRKDEWEPYLRRMGFYLGKFIYLMDAYEDRGKDEKSGSYNPLLLKQKEGWTDADCEDCLNGMMAECCRAFEMLPIVEDAPLLKNILYAGVWTRFELLNARKESSASKV